MKLDFFKIPYTLAAIMIALPLGVEAVVWANLITTSVSFFVNAYLPGKMFGYGPLSQLRDWKYIILSVILMILCVLFVESCINNLWLQLIMGLIVGLISYLGCCFLFKQVSISEIKSLIKRS